MCACVSVCVSVWSVENYHCILDSMTKVFYTCQAALFALCIDTRRSVSVSVGVGLQASGAGPRPCHSQIALKSFDMLRQVCHMSCVAICVVAPAAKTRRRMPENCFKVCQHFRTRVLVK